MSATIRRTLSTARQLALYSTLLFSCATIIKINHQFQTTSAEFRVDSENAEIPQPKLFTPETAPKVKETITVGMAKMQNSSDSVFIAVKTTKKWHDTRVRLILDTWFLLEPQSVSANLINL